MILDIQNQVRHRFVEAVRQVFDLAVDAPAIAYPPSVELGELSITACFELAKRLRQPPRRIAEQLAARMLPIEGVERVSVAGGGYLNLHLDRAVVTTQLVQRLNADAALNVAPEGEGGEKAAKILVEHTSINPNKAAHIGHLRNAVLGDAFVRLLKFRGRRVETQNYIDNTGVQVADVVVGFAHLEKKSADEVTRLIQDPSVRFDYYCWDLYARTFQFYEDHPEALELRAEALKAIEEGEGELARIGELVSTAIVRKHLETMWRVNVEYDLLVQESEILRLDFWKSAFELMKKTGAIRYEESGKNRGCWVMSLRPASEERASSAERESRKTHEKEKPGTVEEGDDAEQTEPANEDVKIIVRSNGTVTYVGKDIAYHLWKFGLLGKDFGYEVFHAYPDGHQVWRTTVEGAGSKESGIGDFGHASAAYAVIDTRQSYVQNVVRSAFHALGYHAQAEHLHHLAYEVVGLSPRCAEEMGLKVGGDDVQKGYIEVSGRKGLGIKADDLIQRLIEKASEEVRARQMTGDVAEQARYARQIAVGALRYFLLKFTRHSIIAFDFEEALAFEGETGPYLQYSAVRAVNIFRKFAEAGPAVVPHADLHRSFPPGRLKSFLSGDEGRGFWEMVLLAAQFETYADQAIADQEPAVVAKYAFRLAQAFNNFYHRHHILSEPDAERQRFLLYLVQLVLATLLQALETLGIEVPDKM